MAIALTSATPSIINTSVDSAGFLSSNWTPTTGAVTVALVGNSKAAAPDTVTVTGNGMTWSVATTIKWTNDLFRLTVLTGYAASPSFGATNFQFGADQTGCFVRLAEFTGVNTAAPVVRSATTATNTGSNSTAIRMTLGAGPAAGNAWVMMASKNATLAWNTNTSDTTLNGNNYSTPGVGWITAYNLSPSGTLEDAYYASAIVANGGIVIELAAGGTAGSVVDSNLVNSNLVGSAIAW